MLVPVAREVGPLSVGHRQQPRFASPTLATADPVVVLVSRARSRTHVVPPYRELAAAYDLIHDRKPYAQEARKVRELARRFARRPLRSLLDVACGSGRHLEQFVRWFDCAGVDASSRMLARARRRVPQAQLVVGRMESFDLGRQFDVVTCLFSAIGYVRSVHELRGTIRNLARHAAPGGVIVVEPWIPPSAFLAGHVGYVVRKSEGTTVLRMDAGRRRGGRSIFAFHYLVGRPGRVDHFVETHDCGLFSVRTMMTAFRDAGLTVRHLRQGLATHRGLYVACRPATAISRPPVRPKAGRSRRRAGR